jgi:hypothetical protein
MITPGGAIVRFLSVFGTIEETSANDRPQEVRSFASSVCHFPLCESNLRKIKRKRK